MGKTFCCDSCEYYHDCKGNHQDCLKQVFEEILSTLSPREEQLLKYLYGYDGVRHTLVDANRELYIRGESLQQVKAKALRKLRHPTRSNPLKKYLYSIFHCSVNNFYALIAFEVFGLMKDSPFVVYAQKGVNFSTIEKAYEDMGKAERLIIKEVNSSISDLPALSKYALLLEKAGIKTLNDLLNSDGRTIYIRAFEHKEYLIYEIQAVLNEMGYRIQGKFDSLYIDDEIVELVERKVNAVNPILSNIYYEKIENTELSDEIKNWLIQMRIENVSQLLIRSKGYFRQVMSMSENEVQEIICYLEMNGLGLSCEDYVAYKLKKQEFERYCHVIKNVVLQVLKEQLEERQQSGYELLDSVDDKAFTSISMLAAELQARGYKIDKTAILDTKKNIKDAPIEALDLSVRAYNCLKRARCNTVSDIRQLSEETMRAIRNLGGKSFDEVKEKLAIFDCSAPNSSFISEYIDGCGLPDSFNEMDLPEIIIARFIRVGIFSPREMAMLSKEDLLAIRGMSESDLPVIEQSISQYGLKLNYPELLEMVCTLDSRLWA